MILVATVAAGTLGAGRAILAKVAHLVAMVALNTFGRAWRGAFISEMSWLLALAAQLLGTVGAITSTVTLALTDGALDLGSLVGLLNGICLAMLADMA